MPSRTSGGRGRRGFSLIEVMAVVAIVGILAVLAVVGYRRWALAARVGDTKDLMLGLVTGLKAYKEQTGGYLNCSSSYSDWYPKKPNSRKHLFHQSPPNKCWNLVAASVADPTYMSFILRAGVANEAIPPPPTKTPLDYKAPNEPWFILVANGDMDEDNVLSYFTLSSVQPSQIYTENEDE